IGKALAAECALQGAQVILSARRLEELEKVRVSLLHPDHHLSVAMDITDEAQVRHAYEQVLDQKGRIDLLINNAGLSQRALIAETSMQTERAIMEIDYFFTSFF
ncbi:SDR family NAD(P)-dependent oxidoreductase, partial [Vogesella mureinivorans]|uniref:SDR family NAD(P)-dependent oxidoreductase n=1 Tax=Vogesella mureinivorans TaxID=657276 RepID=UPI0011CB09C5